MRYPVINRLIAIYTVLELTIEKVIDMRIVLLMLLLALPSVVHAKKTLDTYIHKLCNKQCVNAQRLKRAVKVANTKYKLPKHLVMAVLKTESKFKKKAYYSGNYGLMQVNLTVHEEKFAGKSPFHVETNIDIGAQVLHDCLIRYKSIKQTLVCYKGDFSQQYQDEVMRTMLVLASLD